MLKQVTPDQRESTLIAFNRNRALSPFGGPIGKDDLVKVRNRGYKLATAGGASGEEQRRQWIEHFDMEPDIVASKAEILGLVSSAEAVILVDDAPMQAEGIRHMYPQQFLDWLRGEPGHPEIACPRCRSREAYLLATSHVGDTVTSKGVCPACKLRFTRPLLELQAACLETEKADNQLVTGHPPTTEEVGQQPADWGPLPKPKKGISGWLREKIRNWLFADGAKPVEPVNTEFAEPPKHGTVYVKGDRVTFAPLTADPSSCVAGDQWVRTDTGKLKFAIDTAVANAKSAPTTDASEITSGRFGMARMPDGTAGYVLKAQGAGVDPVYAPLSVAITTLEAVDRSGYYNTSGGYWETIDTCSVPDTAEKVMMGFTFSNEGGSTLSGVRLLYQGSVKDSYSGTGIANRGVHWSGAANGGGTVEYQVYADGVTTVYHSGYVWSAKVS